MFAPIIIAAACCRLIKPTFTKPTIKTVVTPELCISAVVIVPIPTLTSFLLPVLLKSVFIPPVASCSMLDVSRLTPIKNTPVPANTLAKNSKISCIYLLYDSIKSVNIVGIFPFFNYVLVFICLTLLLCYRLRLFSHRISRLICSPYMIIQKKQAKSQRSCPRKRKLGEDYFE